MHRILMVLISLSFLGLNACAGITAGAALEAAGSIGGTLLGGAIFDKKGNTTNNYYVNVFPPPIIAPPAELAQVQTPDPPQFQDGKQLYGVISH